MFPTKKLPKTSITFCCDLCDYVTSRKSQYDKHLSTAKHKNLQNPILIKNDVKTYICCCGKKYKHSSTLYSHKKMCQLLKSKEETPKITDDALIMMLINQCKELRDENRELIEILKNGTTINNTNSHNKTFNLQFFLIETCKDAMNIMDFVDSIKLTLSDLEKVGKIGYVEGISNIITTNLKALDVTQRPIHCTDTKREILYVKDENKWEKEVDKKVKLNKAITNIANKNIRMIPIWREQNPDCIHSDSHKSDQYNDIILNSMDTDKNSNQKIITNIAKEIKIDKETGGDTHVL